MPTLSINDIEIGSLIKFRSKRDTDLVNWRGSLEGRVSYTVAKGYMDPRSYNEAVRQVDPSVPSDVLVLDYFIITVDNDSSQKTVMLFAEQWIEAGSLLELNLGNKVKLQIEDPFSNTQNILSLLASAGYKSKVI